MKRRTGEAFNRSSPLLSTDEILCKVQESLLNRYWAKWERHGRVVENKVGLPDDKDRSVMLLGNMKGCNFYEW